MKGIWMNLQRKIAKKGCIRCSFEAHERKPKETKGKTKSGNKQK